jgi:uncharacterized protein with FMN-binding domain
VARDAIRRPGAGILIVPVLATILGACGGSSSKSQSAGTTTQTAAAAPKATNSTATAPSGTRSVIGSVVANRFGDNQVTLVVKHNKIQDVRYSLPTDRPRSAEINSQAGPLLRQEVLQAQSAKIDVVSGATYTSESFAQSLQAAMQRAHLGA